MLLFRRMGQVIQLGRKIDRTKRDNVRDGEGLPSQVFVILEMSIEEFVVALDDVSILFSHLGNLLFHDRLGERRSVDPDHADGHHQIQFDSSGPHLDAGLFPRAASEERRFGILGFEVTADGDGFGDVAAIVELEDRNSTGHVHTAHEFRRAIRTLHDVHLFEGDFNAFFGQIDVHASRIGCAGESI